MKKKLTIIIPIYNPILPIEKILNNIYKQKSEGFNAIIVIDNPKNDHFYELDKLQNKNYENLKIIFNTSHQNFDIKLKEVLNFVETPYIYILYQNYKIKSEFIERINLFLENLETQPDLIEIPFSKKEFLYSIYKDEILPSLGLVELEKNNLPIALASQSIFNYIVKKEMIEEVINKWKIKDLNFENSTKFIFEVILKSKTYIYFKNTWIRDLNGKFFMFNIQSLSRTWNSIIASIAQDQIDKKNAIEFARFMSYCYYIAGFLGIFKIKNDSLKSKVFNSMSESLLKEIEKQKEFWLKEINENPYFKQFKISDLNELTNQFTKKWNLIFKKFVW